jgi:hypothetical protein
LSVLLEFKTVLSLFGPHENHSQFTVEHLFNQSLGPKIYFIQNIERKREVCHAVQRTRNFFRCRTSVGEMKRSGFLWGFWRELREMEWRKEKGKKCVGG